jgi:hypothetical protein
LGTIDADHVYPYCLLLNLHESKFPFSVSGMSMNYPPEAGNDQERAPFTSLLDAIIPALFANDAAFARKLDINQSQVHRWRRGVKPQIIMLVRISDATGISVETLAKIVGYEPNRKGNHS